MGWLLRLLAVTMLEPKIASIASLHPQRRILRQIRFGCFRRHALGIVCKNSDLLSSKNSACIT